MSAASPKDARAWVTHDEIWVEAERLVVQEGWEYARVAEHLRVPLSTLQKRAARGQWRQQRQRALSYRAQVQRLKARVLQDTLKAWEEAKTPAERVAAVQLTHAWRGLETAFPEHRYPQQEAETKEDDPIAAMSDDELHQLVRAAVKEQAS